MYKENTIEVSPKFSTWTHNPLKMEYYLQNADRIAGVEGGRSFMNKNTKASIKGRN